MSAAPDIAANLARVRARIQAALGEARRDVDAVELIAVSKTWGPDRIEPAIAAGQRVFGENRVQEAQTKWPALKRAHDGVELRLIGPLQTNKVRDALALFDVIETVDRPKLARRLADAIAAGAATPRLLIQVNTGEEPQKAGVAPAEADRFIAEARGPLGLAIEGLMCIPPLGAAPAPHFALLAEIATRNGLETLSMGMSGDYEVAIHQGATHVRVGSAIFGEREKRP